LLRRIAIEGTVIAAELQSLAKSTIKRHGFEAGFGWDADLRAGA
jgi:hypothetical protein